MKTALITGISGQDGIYLSQLLLSKGYRVIGLTRNRSDRLKRRLSYLQIDGHSNLDILQCDLLAISQIIQILKLYSPNEIYNLAAQSSVGLSFLQPIATMQFNVGSVLNILEAIRLVDSNIKFYQASSSEMFGKVDTLPINENTVFHPLSPYATSKASAHWLAVNYREAYNLFVSCGILFNHESFLRDKMFFVKKIIRESILISRNQQSELRVGNIEVSRDFGYSPKYVEAMWLMMQQQEPKDYIVCSGQSVKLKSIIEYVFNKLSISMDKLIIDQDLYRPTDILDIYGDNSKAKEELNWNYDLSFFEVLDIMIDEELNYGF